MSRSKSAKLKVLVQINISREPQKNGKFQIISTLIQPRFSQSGINQDDLVEVVRFINDNCSNLSFQGIMAIGSFDNLQSSDIEFSRMRELFDSLKVYLNREDLTLSMGMTDSMKIAIKHGSTQLRIGTAILGQRQQAKV